MADWVIAALPLTAETHHLFDETFFPSPQCGLYQCRAGRRSMKRRLSARWRTEISVSLCSMCLEEEPLPPHSPLWEHPNVLITPHIAALTSTEDAASCSILDTSLHRSGYTA
ncbi:hypothetical protein F6Y04_00945 [Bacillus megaterium]|nr:hypothetical protein [Priestia megaterium]